MLFSVVGLIVVTLAGARPAQAAPPPNDNYLASTTINAPTGALPPEFKQSVNTSEATTQLDTFDPNRDGTPFGGGTPEPKRCPGGASYGKTVWYDFVPPTAGGVRMVATGLDAVLAVYEWNPQTSQLGHLVACGNASAGVSEELLLQPQLRRGRNYTIQLGGVNDAGGPLELSFESFPDRDGDGVLDEAPDKCLSLAGIAAFGGCPPLVRGAPRVSVRFGGGGVQVGRLSVDRADIGSRIEVRCRRCGRKVRARAARGGSVRIRAFEGRFVSIGDRIEVRLTRPRARSGRFRFGAFGKVITWPVTASGLGASKVRCTRPGSKRRIACP